MKWMRCINSRFKILDQIWPIIEHYRGKCADSNRFLLSLIKRRTPELQYKDIINERSRYNKNLKVLGAMAGIEENLTGYVARHSFASIADDMEVPITVISKMLGHRQISTTQSYLSNLRKNRIDEYQDPVVVVI